MIDYKLAEPRDLRQFVFLWEKYLKENYEAGDITLPSKNNLGFFKRAARHYISNPDQGAVVMAFEGKVPVGVAMWGAFAELGLDTTLGKIAKGWGSYVVPNHRGQGISRGLRTVAVDWLRRIGVQAVIGGVSLTDEASRESVFKFGFEPLHTVVAYRIKEG